MQKDAYSPVSCDFVDDIEILAMKKQSTKVVYFTAPETIDEAKGVIEDRFTNEGEEFLKVDNGKQIRLDKIITLNGLPGPAYTTYERFGEACHECK